MAAHVTIDDRWLAEASRLLEQDDTTSTLAFDHPANQKARADGGDLESRVVQRAYGLDQAEALLHGRQHTRQALALVITAAVVMALLAGAGAARTVLSRGDPPQPIFFFELLATLLGLQSLLLLVWLVLMLCRPAGRALSGFSLGTVVLSLARRLTAALHRDSPHAVAVTATFSIMFSRSIGRWTISAISHGMWLAFNMACLVILTLLLSVHEFSFVWQTTILDRSEYQTLTRAISFLPRAAGFGPLPADEDVVRSEWSADATIQPSGSPAARPEMHVGLRQKWSALLVGCLVTYGIAPRLILLGFSLSMRRAACRRWRLDLSHAYYVRLERVLMPSRRAVASADDDHAVATSQASPGTGRETFERLPDRKSSGPPMIAGIELPQPPSTWPPRLHHVRWQDAGFIETGDDRHRMLDELRLTDPLPRTLVLVVALTTTPDRGIERFLRELRSIGPPTVWLILTGGQSMRDRQQQESLELRIEEWKALASRAGLDTSRVRAIDLDNLTDVTARMLSEVTGGTDQPVADGAGTTASERHIEEAFALIAEHAGPWFDDHAPPEHAQVVELHRRIGKLYRQTHASWSDLLHAPKAVLHSLPGRLEKSSKRFIELLPDRLRSSGRWLTAGAIAGAAGCVASAALLSPAVISALPIWAGVGGGLTTIIDLYRRRDHAARAQQEVDTPDSERDAAVQARIDALRSTVLFTLLLESQGYPEAAITRLLDATLTEALVEAAPVSSAALVCWLDDVRHQYDLALVRESRA
jgi:hypothetical protein